MKCLFVSIVFLALSVTAYGGPLHARKIPGLHLHRERQDGPSGNRHHLRGESAGQTEPGSGEEDPEPTAQILKVNQQAGRFPSGMPPLEFGDIAVDPLGNADRCASDRCRWPSAPNRQVLVPYEISRNYSPNERAIIMNAIESFAMRTCIVFIPRTNQRDYLFIEPQMGCWSYIGRTGGRQVVSLQRNGCVFTGTVQHELLHALGFHHEQNRSDRDGFVAIMLENIMPGMEHNFRKVNTNNLGLRYDYASIMHYSRTAFSRNGRPTIMPRPDPNTAIGTSRQFTDTDINKVNSLYCSASSVNQKILREF